MTRNASRYIVNKQHVGKVLQATAVCLWVGLAGLTGAESRAEDVVQSGKFTSWTKEEICKQIPGGCSKPIVPKYWTDEERAQVIEALDRYPKWEVPKLWPSQESKVFWLDDVRVLISVRELPNGWKAAVDEKSKIVAINTDTRQIEETPYRGDLVCYSPERMVVFDYPRPFLHYRIPGDTIQDTQRYVAGRYGQQLEAINWPNKDEMLSNIGCRISPRDGGTGEEVTVIPLLPGDGSIYSYRRGADAHKQFWVNSKGERVFQIPKGARAPLPTGVFYASWLNAYFFQDATANPQQLLSMSGEYKRIPTPPLLLYWTLSHVGDGVARPVQPGILWKFSSYEAYYQKQGLYLQTSEDLYRIDDGYVAVRWAASENGCRFFYGRVEGQHRSSVDNLQNQFRNYVINFCEGKSK